MILREVDQYVWIALTMADRSGEGAITFDSDGFSITQSHLTNDSGDNVVTWNWKANGGTTSSNTDGTITSTVQANVNAGFSIVLYTGTGVRHCWAWIRCSAKDDLHQRAR